MSAARDYNVSTVLEDMPESKRKGRIYDSYDRHNAGVITRAVFSALERAGARWWDSAAAKGATSTSGIPKF